MFSLPSLTQKLAISKASFLTPIRQLGALGYLKPHEGSTFNYKKLGRGQSSGKGKTAGRGQKGQKARSKVPWWFEGGQTPYYKRFPITGFRKPYQTVLEEVNLSKIQDFWDNGRIPLQKGETLNIKVMKDCGLVTGSLKDGIKILGKGVENYNVPLNIEASRASDIAIQAIEKAGNSFTARYFTRLGLRAHVNPEQFLLKRGYVPLQARPTHKRDIEFYSNPDKRGYLQKDRSILLDPLEKAREELANKKPTKKLSKFKSLEEQLEEASTISYKPSKTISVSDV
ncbi:ribosomal protein L15 [Candida albicans P57072]|uniref:Mitochondrial 54S ribosomal protein YmL10/YmL18 n=4 Tax=Candida albicans TaxID=5476 RepID=Q59ZI7_CANAL|nr:mitochondrial 54S ribosomal protein YmL10/YmL18 [Candida albicans SC5314]EEQ45913.1 conserved hypothetical protein [Candida albicans WO-1]KAF6063458.1 ribosomal protein L15 [Candida albicans]KGQ89048.1 ribosomal protein L15 [Candida albicans P94015]KGQ96371.1 ribosomal protein L15 [Candida albicans P37005]KGR12262.1 ribosomal protein L15 [Candida albicans P57072]KGR13497.1 ribosomal protein L15 [Candida albicans P78048]KGR20857.1 ribosomal protein L15 [Candida albicans P37037]KGT70694.1 |eukprot:XP_714891.1 mitochondrial 54S ribosomal protein YmL10/YmL18 [Candida albicans SC5314]